MKMLRLAARGERCLIIDADWYFGNQHILANVVPEYSLADLLADSSKAGSTITKIRDRLDLIASPSAISADRDCTIDSFTHFLAAARDTFSRYDFILIDAASGFSELILLAANSSDLNLIVLNPELTSISDGYGLFKYLLKSNSKIAVHFLNNRVRETAEYNYIIQKLIELSQKFLGAVPLDAGYLLEDKLVVESVAQQRPLIDLAAESSVIDRFRDIIKIIDFEKDECGAISIDGLQKQVNSENSLADIKE